MTQSAVLIDRPVEKSGRGSPAAQHVSHLLGSDEISPDDMYRTLAAMPDEDLLHFGLRSYRMNLMALFADRWSPETILQKAREAALSKIWLGWEYHHHYLPNLTASPASTQLEAYPFDAIRSQLARGRGLVIVSFHLGHMRHIASDLAHAGTPVLIPLARDAYGNYETARLSNPDAALWKHFRHLCVEVPGGSISMARALAKGACVFSTIDGNTGIDGPRGDSRRSIVKLHGTTARVKNGLITLAARFGAPLLPIIATTVNGARVCNTLPLVDPQKPLQGEEAEAFVENALQTLYGHFADSLADHADEWSGGDLFHQWRIPETTVQKPLNHVDQQLHADLDRGARLRLDTSRVMLLSDQGEHVFVDVNTMKCYRLSQGNSAFAERLLGFGGGVGIDHINDFSHEARGDIWRFLCLLASRGVLSAERDGAAG